MLNQAISDWNTEMDQVGKNSFDSHEDEAAVSIVKVWIKEPVAEDYVPMVGALLDTKATL